MLQPEIRDQAAGRWPDIYSHFGFDEQFLKQRNMPCPDCGGKDRFRFCDYGKGVVICNQCMPDGKDGIAYLMDTTGKQFSELAEDIRSVIGADAIAKPQDDDARKARYRRNALTEVWKSSLPIAGTPVDLYLRSRLLNIPQGKDIRFHPALDYINDDGEFKGKHPAMVCLVRNSDGEKATIHRTYLTADGSKAEVEKPKKLMPRAKEWQGGFIRIHDVPKGDQIVIAEGIETTIAYMQISGISNGWAAVSAGNMAKLRPPEGLTVHIAADNDESFTGQKYAYTLANKLSKTNQVYVDTPDSVGDWADELASGRYTSE